MATVAPRPEVEVCGLSLPRLKRPHSGLPTEAQPFSVSDSTSRQPIFFSGQPSASAMGRGMPIASGLVASDRGFSSVSSLRSAAVASRWSSVSQSEEDGVHTCGSGAPSRRSSHPWASASLATPELVSDTATRAHFPPASSRPESL